MLHQNARFFCESRTFQRMVVWAIVACSILLGVETFYHQPVLIFEVFDGFFTIFFLVEIILRMIAAGNLLRFFKLFTITVEKDEKEGELFSKKWTIKPLETGFWNWFDTLIVVFSLISLFEHLVEHPEFLVVSRLFRVLRIMRLLEVSEELKSVEKKIISIIPTVFSFGLLLAVLIYIYSIIGIYLFGHHGFEKADFSDLPAALLTLFQLMTLDSWSEIMNSTTGDLFAGWFYKGFFISFVILTAIVSFNVFVAVLTSQVHEKMIEEKNETAQALSQQIEEEIEESEAELQKTLAVLLAEVKELRREVQMLKQKP